MKAVFFAHHLVNKGNSDISDAARAAASIFHVDHDAVRTYFKSYCHFDLAKWPGYAEAVAEAEDDPG